MIYYEILMLFKPDTSKEVYEDFKVKLEKMISMDFNGKVETFDHWGKYLLAYQIEKNEYGIYVLVRFGVEINKKEVLNKIKTLFTLKFNNILMRYIIVNIGSILSAEYSKPDSLEDAPRREKDEGGMWINDKYSKNYNSENKSQNLQIETSSF